MLPFDLPGLFNSRRIHLESMRKSLNIFFNPAIESYTNSVGSMPSLLQASMDRGLNMFSLITLLILVPLSMFRQYYRD